MHFKQIFVGNGLKVLCLIKSLFYYLNLTKKPICCLIVGSIVTTYPIYISWQHAPSAYVLCDDGKKKSEIVLILHLLRIKVTLYVNAEHLEIFAVWQLAPVSLKLFWMTRESLFSDLKTAWDIEQKHAGKVRKENIVEHLSTNTVIWSNATTF